MADFYDPVSVAIEAIDDDNIDSLELAIDDGDINDKETLNQLLEMAAESASIQSLDYLFEKIVDLGYDYPEFSTIAYIGIDSGNDEVVRYAFNKCVSFFTNFEDNGYDVNYWTPVIQDARANGRVAIANWLARWFEIPTVGRLRSRYMRR